MLKSQQKHRVEFYQKRACLPEKLCYDSSHVDLLLCSTWFSREEKMAIIADIASIGTAAAAVVFSLWMLKQLFTSK